MTSTAERIAGEVKGLVTEGTDLLDHVRKEKPADVLPFTARYHVWYTRALPAIRTLVPDRMEEFRRQYERDGKRKTIDALNYVIEDYMHGLGAPTDLYDKPLFDTKTATFIKLNNQLGILSSCSSRLSDILANIKGVLQADLFDSELDAARHLLKNGHIRAAGAVAGVVLEGHLAQVCDNHGIKVLKKAPHINDFNEALKKAGVFDVPQWRRIQSLADIRNLCDHKKQREPTPDEVAELIDGVDKAIKTLT